MIIRPRILLLCASTLLVAALSANAPAQQKQPEPTGSISGRVTVMGKAAANIPVLLLTADSPSQRQVIASAKTDGEGGFTLSNLPAGRYLLNPFAPAMTGPATNTGQLGKMISLGEGESVDTANIELSRGGVITGRVMDSNNRPVIGEKITVYLHNEEGRKQEFYRNYETSRTDDRGQYRIYGLPAGRYSVSAGMQLGQGSVRIGFGNTYYPRTFHPDTTDEAGATIVEVKPGSEVTGVDITMGRIEKTYSATGRIVDAETGKPIPDLPYGYGSLSEDGKYIGASGSTGARSGAKGEFLIEGVAPARYVAMIVPWGLSDQQAEFYGDPAFFEIKDSDVSDLEIRVRRGASVSGTVIIEGVDEQTAAEKLKELSLYAQVQAEQLRAPGNSIKVAPDGSFRATGLPPGKVSFHIGYPPIKGLMMLRTEIEGAEQRGPVALSAGQQLTGVKLYFGLGTGKIKVQVRLEDGPLPEGSSVGLHVFRVAEQAPMPQIRPELDLRGRYLFDGLLAGEYELTVADRITVAGAPPILIERVAQKITVANGAETDITLVLKRRDK